METGDLTTLFLVTTLVFSGCVYLETIYNRCADDDFDLDVDPDEDLAGLSASSTRLTPVEQGRPM